MTPASDLGTVACDVLASTTASALAASPRLTRIPWADLLRHGFEIDALACTCGARMRIVAAVTDPAEIRRYLYHLGERTGPPAILRAREPVPVDLSHLPPDDWV